MTGASPGHPQVSVFDRLKDAHARHKAGHADVGGWI
jgi:hypothetical protein